MIDFEFALEAWERLGAAAAGLIIITYLLLAEKKSISNERASHREERQEWRDSVEGMTARNLHALEIMRLSNESLNKTTADTFKSYREDHKEWHQDNLSALEELTSAIKSSKEL